VVAADPHVLESADAQHPVVDAGQELLAVGGIAPEGRGRAVGEERAAGLGQVDLLVLERLERDERGAVLRAFGTRPTAGEAQRDLARAIGVQRAGLEAQLGTDLVRARVDVDDLELRVALAALARTRLSW
jgi:hypothetical protein